MNNNGRHPSRIGRYVVVESIGHGDTSRVYAGVDQSIGRRVAVRVGRAGDPRVHQRARLTGQVAHPNVVSVLDLGDQNGDPFSVMELLEGVTLTEDLRPRRGGPGGAAALSQRRRRGSLGTSRREW